MKTIQVIKPGTPVSVLGLEGPVVVSLCIYPGGRVTYQVAWMKDGSRHEQWVPEHEVSSAADETLSVGFNINGALPVME